MSGEVLAKMSPRLPAELCAEKQIDLGEEAQRILEANESPTEFLRALIAEGQFIEAVRYLAHGLPRREAVWWACQSIRAAAIPASAEAAACLRAAEGWVYEPDEAHRAAAAEAAERAGSDSAPGLAALAVAFGGGSIAPPEVEPIAPAPHLSGAMVACAVILAAVHGPAAEREETFRRLLARGIEIAMGKGVK